MKNIAIETPKQHEKGSINKNSNVQELGRKEMLINKLQANWTNVGPKEGVNLKKNVAQISTNAKMLKNKQQCIIHNFL